MGMSYSSSNVIGPAEFHAPDTSLANMYTAMSGSFLFCHRDFHHIIKPSTRLSVIGSSERATFHGAGVHYLNSDGEHEIFLTSNLAWDRAEIATGGRKWRLAYLFKMRIELLLGLEQGPEPDAEWLVPLPASMSYPTPNGACLYGGKLLLCNQGYGTDQPASLVAIDPEAPYESTTLLNNFHGRPFNSPNDVAVLSTWRQLHQSHCSHPVLGQRSYGDRYSTVWFTDPPYGHAQSFKPAPQLPAQVYCFDPWTGSVRAVADGFERPNGIAFSPNGSVCYITDTGMVSGSGAIDGTKPGSIYAFDISYPPHGVDPARAGPQLGNRRLFAFTDAGVPAGIKVDKQGNVYCGCFDGIHVWNEYGTLLGKILFTSGSEPPDACANFCFIPGGRILGFAEKRLYMVEGLGVEGELLWL